MTTTPPTITNPAATAVNTVVNDAVQAAENVIDMEAETALDAAAPIFALPVIKPVTDAVIEEVVSLIGKQVSIGLQEVGTFIVIDTQVSGEKSGVSQALANLMIAEKSGDPNAIKIAFQAYADDNSLLVHDDGSAPPVA